MILSNSAGPRAEFSLVEIRVFSSGDGGQTYPVEMEVPGWRSFPPGALQLDLAKLAGLAGDPQAYGRALGETVFAANALGDALQQTLTATAARGEALRFRLRLDSPELEALGWERILAPLNGQWQPLAANAATPFSRFVLAQNWERPAPVTDRPLKLLAVIASPGDIEDFALDPIAGAERQALHKLLDDLPDVAVTYLESGSAASPTVNRLRTELANGYHLVHFLCHGAATASGTVLFLEDDAGKADAAQADRLLGAFSLVKTPPLLGFLAACETAARSRHDAFVPLGPALVERGGLLAVVAMSDLVGVETARLFTGQFYARLLNHGLVDLAVNEARALVQDQWDWGVPVMFSRLYDSQLIDFPVGRPVAELGGVAVTVDRALEAARRQDQGELLIGELEQILEGFKTSFRKLVELGTQFRATGSDPATFSQQFRPFYVSFKDYYDQETFDDEDALLRQMMRLRAETLPKLRPLLDRNAYDELKAELDQMVVNRAGLIQGFGEYLEPLNTAVDEIMALLNAGDLKGAIARKLAFETQISPSLRRSKELLGQISSGITRAEAA